jgi:hypothetical protein
MLMTNALLMTNLLPLPASPLAPPEFLLYLA